MGRGPTRISGRSSRSPRAREAGHDPKEAFWKTYTANHPTPDHVSPDAVSEHWNPHTLAAELDRIIEEKDRKLIGRTDGYEEVWLAIHTGEPMIDLVMIAATKELRKYHPSQIDGVVLVLDYRPWLTRNDGNYPMIEIF